MKDIMDDPDKAADDFVKFVPEWKGKEAAVKAAFKNYAQLVYRARSNSARVSVENG
jgi:NitT/TauT family transport system substrate-binding protein